MNTDSDWNDLFDRLIDAGDDILASIRRNDFDQVAADLDRRARLLRKLEETAESEDPRSHARWAQVSERLENQHALIHSALTDQRDEIQEQLGDVREYQTATTAYGSSPPRGPRRILSDSVQG